MNPKLLATLFAAFLAAFSLITPAPQPNSIEAARLNNLGVAYMNQQLFEKGLKQFQQAAEADPKFSIARLNEGVAYLNLQKVDQAKADARRLAQAGSKESERLVQPRAAGEEHRRRPGVDRSVQARH